MTKKFAPSGGFGIAVALALLVPLAAGGVLALRASSESPLESAQNVAPLVGTIESATRSREASVAITVEFADAVSPVANTQGVVTALNLAPGAMIETGTVLADVNGQRVVAYTSDTPLWQDIYKGSKGADVKVAQQLLLDLGFNPGAVDGNAGSGTERAIKAFNARYGYGADNTAFSLSSLVWIGTTPVTVDAVSVHLGDQLSAGTALFTTTAGYAAIKVSETPNVPRDAEIELDVNGVTAAYEAGAGRVTDPAIVKAMAESLGTATEGVGTVRLVTPLTVATVPSSAVVTDEQGRTCIFASDTSGPTLVTPLGGSLGTVDLDPALVGQAVLINPREVRKDLTCGS